MARKFYTKSPDLKEAKRLLWLFIPHDEGVLPVNLGGGSHGGGGGRGDDPGDDNQDNDDNDKGGDHWKK